MDERYTNPSSENEEKRLAATHARKNQVMFAQQGVTPPINNREKERFGKWNEMDGINDYI